MQVDCKAYLRIWTQPAARSSRCAKKYGLYVLPQLAAKQLTIVTECDDLLREHDDALARLLGLTSATVPDRHDSPSMKVARAKALAKVTAAC